MIEIRRIEPTRANLLRFINFKLNLYKGNDCFVPPLVMDELATLQPKKNPAFDFCDAAYFMAYRDGKPQGRIAAIINRQVNEKSDEQSCRFGFVDFVDDPEVVKALFKAAEDWGRQKGMKRMVGPLGFTDLDPEGTLVEGFDELSTMATIYNYPYYSKRIEELGYAKDSDWVEFVMDVPDGIPEKFNRIADIVRRKYGLSTVRYTSRKKIKEDYGRAIFDLFNECYADLYEYSPLTERQIQHYIDQYLNLLDLNLVSLVIDSERQLVGVGISMPSMSRALQRSGGRFLPFGWYHLLKGLKGRNDRVDLMMVAVKPAYQNKGANAILFQDLIPEYIKKGFKFAESNPELETNAKVQGQWEYFGHRQHRRRRSYTKKL